MPKYEIVLHYVFDLRLSIPNLQCPNVNIKPTWQRLNGSGIAENIAVYVAAESMNYLRESCRGIDNKNTV